MTSTRGLKKAMRTSDRCRGASVQRGGPTHHGGGGRRPRWIYLVWRFASWKGSSAIALLHRRRRSRTVSHLTRRTPAARHSADPTAFGDSHPTVAPRARSCQGFLRPDCASWRNCTTSGVNQHQAPHFTAGFGSLLHQAVVQKCTKTGPGGRHSVERDDGPGRCRRRGRQPAAGT